MPLELRKLMKEVTKAGCSIQKTQGGHYLLLDKDGNPIEGFATSHGKKQEILDSYLVKIRKALKNMREKQKQKRKAD